MKLLLWISKAGGNDPTKPEGLGNDSASLCVRKVSFVHPPSIDLFAERNSLPGRDSGYR